MALKNIKGHSTLLIMRKIQGKTPLTCQFLTYQIGKDQTFYLNFKTLRLREPDTIIYYYWECKQVL